MIRMLAHVVVGFLARCVRLSGLNANASAIDHVSGNADLLSAVSSSDDVVHSLPGLHEPIGVQFAGYASINSPLSPVLQDDGMFYWFVGSKTADFRTRPTILWTNGGPGSSSFWGFFLENGPYEISGTRGEPHLKPRSHAWTDMANYLIFEHPLGVTLSVPSEDDNLPRNVSQGISQLHNALMSFMQKHPEIAETPLILAGESYAGTYLPLLAQNILEHSKCRSCQRLDLRAVILVDAWVNPTVQMSQDTEYAARHGLISDSEKVTLDLAYAKNLIEVEAAIMNLSGVYMLNTAVRGDPPTQPVLDYLNRADVRAAIHAKQGPPLTQMFADNISELYHEGLEDSYQGVVQALVDAGLQLLVVSGLNDATDCNFLGTERWLKSLSGPTATSFWEAQPTIWRESSGRSVGYIQESSNAALQWIKVLNAGHLAVADQPLLIDLFMERVMLKPQTDTVHV